MAGRVGQRWEDGVFERGERSGADRSRVATRREDLRDILEERFGILPAEVAQRLEAIEDAERLRILLRQAVRVKELAELAL